MAKKPTLVPESVTITATGFQPPDVTVAVGGCVLWTNGDAGVHSVVSDAFASDDLQSGDTFEHTFASAGEYQYADHHNAGAKGKVTVA